jgi:hypothetical protein
MPDIGSRKPSFDRITPTIRLEDDVDSLDPVEVASIAILAPIGSAGYAKGRKSMKPQGMAV